MLGHALSAVAVRLDAKDAAAVSASAAAVLAQAMKEDKEPQSSVFLAEGLSVVAIRLMPKDGMTTLVQAVKDAKNPQAVTLLAQGLPTAAARLESKDVALAASAAAAFAQAIKDAKDPNTLLALVAGSVGIGGPPGRPRMRRLLPHQRRPPSSRP